MPDQPDDKKEYSQQLQEDQETGKVGRTDPDDSKVYDTERKSSENQQQADQPVEGEEQHGSVKNSK